MTTFSTLDYAVQSVACRAALLPSFQWFTLPTSMRANVYPGNIFLKDSYNVSLHSVGVWILQLTEDIVPVMDPHKGTVFPLSTLIKPAHLT